MKKTSLFYSLLFIASVIFLGSCGNKDDEAPQPTTPDECEAAVYPTSDGSATISFLNFATTEINASAGSLVSFAVSIQKGSDRTKKLRVYQSDCKNSLGTIVEFKGQTKFSGDAFDLRNTDEVQIRNVNYTVPTGMTPIYLNFVTEEKAGKKSYKQVKLNVSGSGVLNNWTGVELGGNSNDLGSRMSSGTGQTYKACNAAENIEYIDITYAVKTTGAFNSYICSNPARFESPVSLGASSAPCGDDGTLSTDGGKATYFKSSTADFDAATDASLSGLTVSSSSNQYVEVTAANQVFEFLNSDGKKGLIKVTAVNKLNQTGGSITVAVKVQR